MTIAAALPGIALALFIIIFRRYERDGRVAMLSGAVAWGSVLFAFTELLSIGHRLTGTSLLVAWGLLDVVLIGCYWSLRKRPVEPFRIRPDVPFSGFDRTTIASIAAIVAAVGLIAIVSAPNNWDSMDYHMGRVVHWIQNRSVDYFSTSILRQLYQKPWAEYAITHLQILSGGDRFANIVQWLAMLGSIVGVTAIARELGADRRGQLFAAALCATIPMGILQGSSTQNDYVVCFWLLCFVYYVVSIARESVPHQAHAPRSGGVIHGGRARPGTMRAGSLHPLKVGASLGLAFLAKGSAYVYSLPFFLWYMVLAWQRRRWGALKPLALAGVVILAFNIAHEVRNIEVFGRPLSSGSDPIANEWISVPGVLSNVIRNLAVHSGLRTVEGAVRNVHAWLNIDVDDPRTTVDKFEVPRLIDLYATMHEDHAPNPLHLLAIFAAIGLFLARAALRSNRIAFKYMLALVAAFLLLCILLRWAPHHSRIHLSLFVLFSPFVALVLSDIRAVRARVVVVILLLGALPWVLFNRSRPIVFEVLRAGPMAVKTDYRNIFNTDRVTRMFKNRPELQDAFAGAASDVKARGCFDVGISMYNDEWEYPLWVLLDAHAPGSRYRIEHVQVKNVSARKADPSFRPCAVVSMEDPLLAPAPDLNLAGARYVREWSSGGIHVYVRTGSKP
jgi:4-amino-4-deoxy-L-arabinose transferase-like glycosyltransferase